MKIILICLLFIISGHIVSAQQQYALLIGIDSYAPDSGYKIINTSGRTDWPNLDGCKNDAAAMQNEIIVRWGFKTENIRELYDSSATRKNILFEINRLLQICKKGDIAFVFYAGHGSQVVNSKSPEQDKLDESIVPSDAWKVGVEDIRDKTLAALINQFIDKGILLTTIFDCCHSGSLGRGFSTKLPKFRYMKPSTRDASDASTPVVPEYRQDGLYLSISASQENEPAQEQIDDYNLPHGAFTVALLKAMNQQNINASVNTLFSASRAILKSNGKKQEPVLAGSSQRLRGTLFGLNTGVLQNKTLFPVLTVNDSTVEFQGGFMSGLNIENELVKYGSDLRIMVVTMIGANRCAGRMISGNIKSIRPGELFEVSNWVSSSAPFLTLYIPPALTSNEDVSKVTSVCKELKLNPAVKWANDFERHDPDLNVYYHSRKWMVNGNYTMPLTEFSNAALSKLAKGQFISVNIPPSDQLVIALKNAFTNLRNIRLTDDPDAAQYMLYGTLDNDNHLCYRWLRSQAMTKDSFDPMPLQTKSFALRSDARENIVEVSDNLNESAVRLSKIRAWLNMQPPPASSQFPFHLEIRNESSGTILKEDGILVGNKLSVYLRAEENYLARWDRKKRFVYVFLIDRNGNMNLVYPDENSGNLSNRLPATDEKDQPLSEQKLVEGTVTEPVGTDTYFMLSSDEPIPDYTYAFNQEGVRGNQNNDANNAMNELINLANPSARGLRKPIANNWTLERIPVKTRHK